MVFVGEHGVGEAARWAEQVTRWRIGDGAAVRNARHNRVVSESFANRNIVAMVKGRRRDRLYDF
jgi:hypothetical protein